MKFSKFLVSFLVVTLILTCGLTRVNADSINRNVYDDVAYDYYKVMSQVKENWNSTSITDVVDLKDMNDDTIAYLYNVGTKIEQRGYFVVMELNNKIQVSEATFDSIDVPVNTKGNTYYVAPFGFYTKEEISTINYLIKTQIA